MSDPPGMFRKTKRLKLLKLIGLRGMCTPAASHDAGSGTDMFLIRIHHQYKPGAAPGPGRDPNRKCCGW